MNIRQVNKENWKEVCHPTDLCEVEISVRELERKYGLERFEYYEDGLGEFEAVVFEIDNSMYWVSTCKYDELKHKALFVCRSYEPDTKEAFDRLVKSLEIEEEKITWVNESLGPAKWQLTRVDDNDNEIVMYQFQTKQIADYVQKVYEDRGHKQAYFVKSAI